MPERSTWAEWWGMSCGAVVLDGILWKIVGDLWLLNNFVAAPFLSWSLPNLSSCGLYHVPSGHPWCSEISTGMQVFMERTQWEGARIVHIHLKTFVFWNRRVKFSLCKSLVLYFHSVFSNEVAKVLPSFLCYRNCKAQYISDHYHYWCEFKKLLATLQLWVGDKYRNLQYALADLKQKGLPGWNEHFKPWCEGGIYSYYCLSAFSILLSYSVALEELEMGYFITKSQPEMTWIHVGQVLENC